MALTKQNVCVYIENEAQLNEAKELLEKYGEKVDANMNDLKREFKLVKFCSDGIWRFTKVGTKRPQVYSLLTLEEILKKEAK